jgi:Type II CAAX prenyl endopeptidase Rce1-like
MTRRPLFWIVFAALGLAGAATALELFTVAVPNVALDIAMDRQSAMAEADALAERYGWGPDEARSAASFGQVDGMVQTYVELEGGGRDAFVGLAEEGVYQPYQWRVRRFAEGEVAESRVSFSPGGRPYGFRVRLAEDDPGGGNLSEEAARAVAEAAARDWSVDLAAYEPLDSSEETLPGGRVDHTFVFERSDVTVADARFRLRVVVAGDMASELTHFVHVPEAFTRRYAEMRSTNDTIALVSQSVFILLFVLLGAGVGAAILLRMRWIEWRMPLRWGAAVALLFGLNALNALPLSWMGYDTAISANVFIFQQIAAAGAIMVLGAPLLAFFFMAAESLGRRAFPGHLQQWRFWSRDVAASTSALGMSTAAYLLVGMQVGYVVLFYLGTSRLEGWWSPADALVQPDLLATYAPWLQAVSTALFAGMWEESIFRAVPIACAALIGARYGRRNLWIWGAVVLQAIVFAAGHANYPQQPAYARVVELSLPALGWGVVYLYFGLVPTILAHFLYDLTLISSVLFASDATFDQGVVVLVGLVPLAIVLWARRGGRGGSRPPEWAYNRAWRPTVEGVPAGVEETARQGVPEGSGGSLGEPPTGVRAFGRGPLYGVGAVGLILWLAAVALRPQTPAIELTRAEAVAVARSELEARGVPLERWTVSAFTASGRSDQHLYVFEEAGEDDFRALLGSYLADPEWVVRFVDWDAAPEERVDEWRIYVGTGGAVRRLAHSLPEARTGASLTEEEARAEAVAAVARWGGTETAGALVEVAAEETSRPARTDWDFTFSDSTRLTEVDGEARWSIRIAGGEVSGVRPFVYVPESWQRERRGKTTRRLIVFGGMAMLLFLAFAAAAVMGIVVWSRHSLRARVVPRVGGAMLVVAVASFANAWPATTAVFQTSQPFGFQAGGAAFGLVLVGLVVAAAAGLAAALGQSWHAEDGEDRGDSPAWGGIALGLLVAGIGGIAGVFGDAAASWPDYSGGGAFVPLLAPMLEGLPSFIVVTSGGLALTAAYRRFRGRPALASVVWLAIIALAVLVAPRTLQSSVPNWAASAVVGAALIYGLVRATAAAPAWIPGMLGTMAALGAIGSALAAPYVGARVGNALAALAIAGAAFVWMRALRPPPAPRSAGNTDGPSPLRPPPAGAPPPTAGP